MSERSPYNISSVAELPGHDECAWGVAWNPVRPLLASCSADKSVRFYAYTLSNEHGLGFNHTTTIPTGHRKTVRSLTWSPSGKTLATGSFDSDIGVWEEDDGGDWECAATLEGHETECKCVSYSASGNLLASCSRDKTVWVWEVHPNADFECLAVLMEHTQDVKCVVWHPTEEILASASYDDTIKLYVDDPSEDWYCFATLTGHSSTVWALAWSPNGSYLASASDDKTVRIWKRTAEFQWQCVLVISAHDRSIYSISWGVGCSTGEGSLGWIATTGGDGTIKVWELTESEPEGKPLNATPPTHKLIAAFPSAHGVHDVNAISWCTRKGMEDILATAGDDGITRIWKIVRN